ncbi:MCE family protein [Saccharopolyspora rhizosphaerae]|uniref:MCE family protein n=1 Tax=Saccharopolyspora rhizosphaerae TaxID=2492662 RepID=A0A3R8VBQ6_9PSEU|nr:MlaD family protein [Saccharopolyspora rhizosphaerae]RRO14174.1 MCE family protein [Saccharopolyspora rhizosphaerae]
MRAIRPSLTKLVVFVAVTLLATGLLGITIANTSFGPTTEYSARFTDVTGLNEGDDVRIAGVKVGQVDSIEIAERRQAHVRFTLFGDRSLPASTTASIKYRNLIGQRYLAVEGGEGSPEAMPEGSTIPIDRSRPALNLTVLFNGFKPLLQALAPEDVNKLSHAIIQTLQGEGGTVQSLLSHIASLTQTLASRDQVIGEVVTNLNEVLGTISSRNAELDEVLVQTQQVVSGLAADREQIGSAVEGIGEVNEATAGLLAEGRKPLRESIHHLGVLSRNLDDHRPLVERFASGLPDKLNTINRTASYGSWFNYFLCRSSGQVRISSLGVAVPLPTTPPEQMPGRCR